jgi:hypothetical protein
MSERAAPKRPFLPVGVFVGLAGALVGGACGDLASGMYGGPARPAVAGALLGGAGGLLVGVLWCRVMFPRARSYVRGLRSAGGLVGLGSALGLAAGAADTLLLHAGLSAAAGQVHALGAGLAIVVVGAPAGAVTGLLCGLILWAVAAAHRRRLPRELPEPGPTTP